MEAVYEWVKNLLIGCCLLELFSHMVRREEYRRYVRFFGGMMILLMVISPVFQWMAGDNIIEAALERAFLEEEAINTQLAQETLSELQSRKISEAYRKELERQMAQIADNHQQRAVKTSVELEDEAAAGIAILAVEMELAEKRTQLSVFETETADDGRQQEAISEIRAEIAALYGLDKERIRITVKE